MKSKFDYKDYEILDKREMASGLYFFRIKGDLKFKPGQFIQAAVDHIGEATFAPCSKIEEDKTFDLVVRDCGNTSHAISNLLPGEKIKIRGPYGNGWPTELLEGKELIIIAGGMGMVPLVPLLHELYPRRNYKGVHLVAGFKSEDHILFSDELKEFSDSIDTHIVLEYKRPGGIGRKGIITEGLKEVEFKPKRSLALICGPEIMFSHCVDILRKKGLSDNQIYVSFERRMECGIGLCQHCNIGKYLVCKDGPIFRWDKIKGELTK